ncbi:hypothetical protein ACWDBW_23315 [Streptomyces sp. NPDC001107]
MRRGLGLLALWILLLPDTFWKWRWVSLLPPYSEHLLRDLGGRTSRSRWCCVRRS